ncbi:PqiC family protein [Dyella sp. A6]|uniref:PqiC family protein n=1 Tax=Dyella aluminiiresistens TaxID=3069105 RepID=UPI002E770C57|nr:PqiC family protein [Dyella sp. A6]
MIRLRYPALAALAVMLAACASAPMHYYTLIAPAGSQSPVGAQAPFRFALLPVTIPAQVDQPQLVVRQNAQGVAMLDDHRWIAPLGDEIRGALSADLARDLHTQDVSGLPAGDKPVLRIKVDVRRFDSDPGQYALVEAAWSVHDLKNGAVLACTSRIEKPVGRGFDALVAGHQQALTALAGRIAGVAPAVAGGRVPACPGG